jgi:hypothetical protein
MGGEEEGGVTGIPILDGEQPHRSGGYPITYYVSNAEP